MSRAACHKTDPAIFYPEQGGSYAAARAVCKRCPVINECLQYALDEMTSVRSDMEDLAIGMHGMWGGTSPLERWAILGRRWAA